MAENDYINAITTIPVTSAMKTQFELSYRPSADDYVRFSVYQTRKSNFVSALILVAVYALVVGSETGWNYVPASLAKWLFPFALSVIVIAWIRSKSLAKIKKNFDKNPFFGCDVVCKIDGEGMLFESAGDRRSSTNLLAWYDIHKLVETRAAFYVYVMESMAYVVPKRAFSDAAEVKDFRKFCETNIEADRRMTFKE